MKVTVVNKVYPPLNLPPGTLIFGREPDYGNTFSLFPLRRLGVILRCSPPDGYSTQSLYSILFLDGYVRCEFENYVENYYDWEGK